MPNGDLGPPPQIDFTAPNAEALNYVSIASRLNYNDNKDLKAALASIEKALIDIGKSMTLLLAGDVEWRAWRDGHNAHHGKNDAKIAGRIAEIEKADEVEQARLAAVKAYKARFAWISSIGMDAAKAVAGLAIGSFLVGAGYVIGMVF